MQLRQLFVVNMKKFRKREGLSQWALAERCNIAANYIGQIEMGRRFPSIEIIEQIAGALRVEPYLLFRDDSKLLPGEYQETREFLAALPVHLRRELSSQLLAAVEAGIEETINPEKKGENP
jgi:transcriptional regulator with XRE-family HTH domain